MKHIFFVSIFLCLATFSFAQNPSKTSVKALNNYVQFTNESIHGMMIAHRIFENINQEVNRSVDFPSEQINFYGNKDLPKNLFLDPEQWFYQISPYQWYKIAKTESRFLKSNEAQTLNAHADNIKKIIDRTNKLRFQLDDFIKNSDLQIPKNQTEIFRQMEKGDYDVIVLSLASFMHHDVL